MSRFGRLTKSWPLKRQAQIMPTLRSPNDLLSVTWRALKDNEAEKFARLGSNQARIAALREWAEAAIRADNKEPVDYREIIKLSESISEIANRSYWSARILKRLDEIQGGLTIVERSLDLEIVRNIALRIVNDALLLATELHQLTIADNERPIFTGTRNARNLREKSASANLARKKARERIWSQWNIKAAGIWKRRPELSKRDVARLIKSDLQLADEIDTIAKRLKKPRKAR
jgi:hypothetical protein